MTEEELREEADKLGFKLIRKYTPARFLTCTCGVNSRDHLTKYDRDEGVFYEGLRCKKCGRTVWSKGTSEKAVREAWNKMIEEEQNDQK